MKQLKFLMVALTLLMGISLTSCLDSGDDNPIKQLSLIVKYEGGMYGGGVFKTTDGLELEPADPTLTISLSSGKIYYISFSYNKDEVVANKATKITLLATPTDISGPRVVPSSEASEANAPLFALEYSDGYNVYCPYLFDKYTLILPALFWVKDVNSQNDLMDEIKKHRFEISYDEVEEGVLTLYINHLITESEETTRNKFTINSYAYDLQGIINNAAGDGSTIRKITVKAKTNSSSNTLKDAVDKTFDIDYSKVN